MQQSCATELSEVCTKLEKDFSLPRTTVGQMSVLQGSVFQITHGTMEDGHEKVSYQDKVASALFSDDQLAIYSVKGRYLAGQDSILKKTTLGQRILGRLSRVIEKRRPTSKKIGRCKVTARVQYGNTTEVYDLLKEHILS